MYSYKTSGTCSQQINYDIVDGKVHNVTFVNGCPGNLKAIGILVEGLPSRKLPQTARHSLRQPQHLLRRPAGSGPGAAYKQITTSQIPRKGGTCNV